MAGRERYSVEQFIKAIDGTRGIKSAIASRLGCTRLTVDNYIKRYATVRRAYQEEREKIVDRGEIGLFRKVEAEEWPAIKWVLATLGKSRGYVERSEYTGPDGGALVVQIVQRKDD